MTGSSGKLIRVSGDGGRLRSSSSLLTCGRLPIVMVLILPHQGLAQELVYLVSQQRQLFQVLHKYHGDRTAVEVCCSVTRATYLNLPLYVVHAHCGVNRGR